MNIPRPFAVVLVTACSLVLSIASAFADDPETVTVPESTGDDAQISGTLPDSRAGAVTMQRLTGDESITYGALPSAGFMSVFGNQYWNGNYYTGDAFIPFNLNPGTDYLFTHLRGGATQYGGSGVGNFGLGYAYYSDVWDRLMSSTLYFDLDGQPARTQGQVALHFENLGRYVDFRSDIGIIVTNPTNTLFQGPTGTTSFMANMLLIDARRVTQTSFNHANLEIGGPLAFLGQYGLSAYGQGYYLFNPSANRDTFGGRFRAEWAFTEDISLNVYHSYDNIFKNNTWLNLTLTTPDGPPRHVLSQVPVRERFSKRPIRSGRIPTIREVTRLSVKARNPKTGQPYMVGHIDPNANSNGNGTFEHPYASVAAYQAANKKSSLFDIIYVRPNRTVSGQNLQTSGNGLILFNNQFLLGSTIAHTIPILPTPISGSMVTISPLDPGLPLPILTNSNPNPSSIVVAANGNTISGFDFYGADTHVGISADGNSVIGDGIDDGIIQMISIIDNNFRNTTTGVKIADLSNGMKMPGMPIYSSIIGNTFKNNGTGFDITLDTTNNGADSVDTFDGTTLDILVSGNTVESNTGDGGILTANGPGATVNATIQNNSFNDNGGVSFTISALATSTFNAAITGDTFNRINDGTTGLKINGVDSTLNVTAMQNSYLAGNANSSFGIDATADGGALNLVVAGRSVLNPDVFDQNVGAGIKYQLKGDAVGTINAQNLLFTRTQDDNNPLTPWVGGGISVYLAENSQLHDSVIDHNVFGDVNNAALGNQGNGVGILITNFAALRNLTIGNDNGIKNDGNIMANNRLNGIEFIRRDDGQVDNITIEDNFLTANGVNGLHLVAANRPYVDDYLIQNNMITKNVSNGIAFQVNADARIVANVFNNFIDSNGGSGISMTEQVNSAGDLRFVGGDWESNVITNNGQHGIFSNAATSGLFVGQLGTNAAGQSRGNLIDFNGFDGVEIDGTGTATYTNNTITRNGQNAQGNPAQGGGIDINGPGYKNLTFTDNYIGQNLGDGFELDNNNNGGGFGFTITAVGNSIVENVGRGVDVLNQGNADTVFTLNNNFINGNTLEGVYIIYTSSTTQNQTDPATAPLMADGAVNANGRLILNIDNNRITGNGSGSGFSTNGIVLRVGTSDGGRRSITDDGGFFGEGRGGVGASITNNFLSGNFGDDFYFDSFVSTVDPAATSGTWSATQFTVNSYQTDPLARLDLYFKNNTWDSVDVNNVGAAYTNAEGTFKSRTTGATDPGPFTSATRPRNAERLAARFGLPPVTPGGVSNRYLYPGLGQSTFRLLNGSDTGIFTLDNFYTFFTDANGPPPGANPPQSMPYGWNYYGGNPRPQ